MLKLSLFAAALVLMSGCWNGGNTHVQLGDVSLGQQLIDLKMALDQEAISDTEYQAARDKLLALDALCESTDTGTDSWPG